MSNQVKLQLTYGFSEIQWQIVPRQSILENGKQLFKSGHVKNVTENREQGKPTEIIGDCIRQTNIRDSAYHLSLVLDENRLITGAACQCIAGESGICKHTSALVYFVNEEREETKTDTQCSFVAPSKAGREKYPKGKPLSEIFNFKNKCPKFDFMDVSMETKTEQFQWMEAAGNTSSPLYKILKNREEIARKSLAEAAKKKEEEKTQNVLPTWFFQKVFENSVSDLDFNLTGDLKNNFDNHIRVTPKRASEICLETLSQSTNASWKKHREIRITSSRAHSIYRARSEKTRYEHFTSSPAGTIPALKYGIDMEPVARKKYEEVSGHEIFVPGLVIKPEKAWLGASPDGCFIDENSNLVLLEIKCPFSAKDDENIIVQYLDKDDNLKKSHAYYTQIQLAMYCCNAKECDFFVFNEKTFKLSRVHYDEQFV